MTVRPGEVTHVHTRLLKCALEVEDCRAYWRHAAAPAGITAKKAFDEYWFGAKSLARIEVLLVNMRARFDAFPGTLDVLAKWADMSPETRRVLCHWHLQLADPLYRSFTGEYLLNRRSSDRAAVTRDAVVAWVAEQGPGRWTLATRIQFASKLLSAAFSAGLIGTNRDPRPLVTPRVTDEALEYLLYVLRGVEIAATLLENPYLASVGLDGPAFDDRLRALTGLSYQRQGALVDIAWRYTNLSAWADATVGSADHDLAGIAR